MPWPHSRARLGLEHREVVVEPHPHQRNAAPARRDDGVGHQAHGNGERHALGPGARRRDPVHGLRVSGDLPPGIDQARPAADQDAVYHGDQHVGHGHVVEAVDTGGLEVETEQLTGNPRRHGAELASAV